MIAELILGGSAVYAGAKAFGKRRKARKMAQFLQPEKSTAWVDAAWLETGKGIYDGVKTRSVEKVKRVQAAIQGPELAHSPPAERDTRDMQLKAVSLPVAADREQRGVRGQARGLTIAGLSFGLATAGLVVPVLSLLSIPGMLYNGVGLSKRVFKQLFKDRRVTVDTLIMATVLTGLGLGASIVMSGSAVFLFLVNLNLFLVAYSHKLTSQIRSNSRASIIDVFKQRPGSVWVVADGVEVETPVEELQVGDVIVVNAGEAIPVDGRITEGMASIDQHVLTGEAQPVEKAVGDEVFALTVVMTGKIHIAVEKTGQETVGAQIGHILNQTLEFKADMQLWAESTANQSVVPTLLISGLTFPVLGANSAWAVLLAHPKHKGILATYIGILSYFNVTSKQGVLIKDGRIFELLHKVDTVVFDKTGTLTVEQPHVGPIHTCHGIPEDAILTCAAAAEYRQTHPIARAILQEAASRQLQLPDIDEAAYKVGYGLTVMMDKVQIRVGSLRFIEAEGIAIPPEIRQAQDSAHRQGHSLVMVAIDDQLGGAIELKPTVRSEAKAVIDGLRERGITSTYIISGDHEIPTRKLATELGIDHYFAETLPENKADLIERLQNEGKTVCYVGDGINDAIALKKAAVSVSLRGASTVATDTAQVILMNQSLTKLCDLFDLARSFDRNMKQTVGTVLVPHLLGLGGVLFLHFGIVHAIFLSLLGLAGGIGSGLLPRLQHRETGPAALPSTELAN